jgi:putative nucleotidyltransferase with HDIG domain
MVATPAGWTSELERAFKELLYRFLEEIHSTKAALYLLGPEGSFALMTQYGFGRRDQLAIAHGQGDPYVQKLKEMRVKPRAFNHPEDFPEIAGYLEGAGTARLLLAPICSDSRLVGFVDARDKGRRRPFERSDLSRAAAIARILLDLLRQEHLYPELDEPMEPVAAPPPVSLVEAVAPARAAEGEPGVDRRGLEMVLSTALRAAVAEQITIALTVATGGDAATRIVAAGELGDTDRQALLRHQAQLLEHASLPVPDAAAWRVDARTFAVGRPVERSRALSSAILLDLPGWTLAASVVVSAEAGVAEVVLHQLGEVALSAQELTRLRFARRLLARRLLNPGERQYAELEAHSVAVSHLAWSMAHLLGWGEEAVENAALAGLLHDTGMRELDYERLYRHPSPGPEERRLYQQHVVLGERILSGCGLEPVVEAVRHHHERWDGNGYPDRLSGEEIPELARLVHVAEVYDVLTASHSYRRPVSSERALAILRAAAGHQFDSTLVEVVAQAVE